MVSAHSGFDQLIRKQVRLHSQIAAALQVAGCDGCLGLVHEEFDLAYHLLLAWAERMSGHLLQVLFGCDGELVGSTLVSGLFGGLAANQLYRELVRSSIPDNFLGCRTGRPRR